MLPLLLPCALGNMSVDVAQPESTLFILLMLLTGTDEKTRGLSALYFNFMLKETEAENYPKANTSQSEFSWRGFCFPAKFQSLLGQPRLVNAFTQSIKKIFSRYIFSKV